MSDEPKPLAEDDASPDDPFEAELVAYLDGELDPISARRVEVRLATDPIARQRATALKKTFDLLDYLPRAEPTPTFTTRTLDKLPALKPGTQPVAVPSLTASSPQKAAVASAPSTISSSVPVALSTGAHPVAAARLWLSVAGVLVVIVSLGALGYLGASVLRPHLFPSSAQRDPNHDELPLSDHRLIENLPLYAVADDIEFVQRLADPELFGDEPAMSFDAAKMAASALDTDKTPAPTFEALTKSFKALPPPRQQAIRELDRQINALEPVARERTFRVLEVYAVWLQRLQESERKGVLAAGTPGLRLGVIRELRERQWLDSLPSVQRSQLTGMTSAKKAETIQQWKDDEARRRDLWVFVRKNAEAIALNKAPWPFDTDAGKKEVFEFVRSAFHPDETSRCRLTTAEQDQYRMALASAEKNGAWAWYGKAVYELARKFEMLPEPADVKYMYHDFRDLPASFSKLVERPGLKKKLTPYVGKWPDFPLELHDEFRMGKFGPALGPPLGPARVSDFKEPVRAFWEKDLSVKLTQQERGFLKMLENRWPEYPREFIRLARSRDLSIPGVMLPGSPRMWDATYGSGAPFRASVRP